MHDTPEVLFVCVHNAGRSQMAAALMDHYAAGRVRVRSAGSTPASEVNPAVVAAMREIGVDLSTAVPKRLTDEAVREADAVIAVDPVPPHPGRSTLSREARWLPPGIRDKEDAQATNAVTVIPASPSVLAACSLLVLPGPVAGAPGLLSCGGPLARARPGQGSRAEIGAVRGTTDAGERRLRYLCHYGLFLASGRTISYRSCWRR